ncbi:hypothetical protein WN943_003168 [Citrus x changshan-huyou]
MSMRSTSDDHQLTENGEDAIESAKIERLPTFDRLKSSLFNKENVEENFEIDGKRKKMIDVTKLESLERHGFINKLIKHVGNDNLRLLQRIRNRVDSISEKLSVRVVHGKPLPALYVSIYHDLITTAIE